MNISAHVERAAKFFPERAAILFEGNTWTYRDLNERANRLAKALVANGVRRGDRVALYLLNCPEFALAYVAAMKVGAVAVSVSGLYKSEECKYILNDSGSVAIFTTGDLVLNISRDACPALKHVVVVDGDAQENVKLQDWLAKGAAEFKAVDMDPDEPAVLLYTSGTTGFPKGATLTHGNVVSNTYATVHHARFGPDDRMALFLPMTHVFGQDFIMNSTFLTCATLALYRRFAPDQVLDSVARDRITMFFAVPTIYINLLNMDLSKFDLSSIRYEFSAAATMPQEISRRWTERFGRPVYEGYGLTECSPFAAYNHDFRHKFGSVGTAIENFEVKIFDAQDNEAPLGHWGEIVIRGPGVMKGYWNKPDDTAWTLRKGWLHSGDVGMIDDEGYVFIMDRVKDMINAAGFKVWPAEVEQVLYKHPAVREVAVYGVKDPVKGEAVKAAVVLKQGAAATSEEIIAYCRDRLAVYKAPALVDFVPDLPRNPTGKILKRVLRDQ